MKTVLRLARGAVGNALVWGAAWFGVMFTLLFVLFIAGYPPSLQSLELVLRGAASMGANGLLAGGVFSAFLGLAYRDKSLLEINTAGFTLGGALVAGLAGMLLPNGALLGAMFGGVTASGTIGLAKHASRRLSDSATEELVAEQGEVSVLLGDEAV